ncbi:hypothetical protein KU73_18325 [Pectobacterium wasabiae]|uniref:Uncharacterized protein n=1 Tax=Pectobacterium wasabiae TaxID=55208 RepID=A0AAW3EDF8_9GAMM|nr:hypothetical protein A7983_04200 [Pectobacterium wasabiae CFBP 3304]EJS93833.1 Hypothetical protein Y17_3088 [Pectobacterium wasabiae CFBP 3304]KFX03971.1 hypothetical protein JV38_18335 [Pectobacterium wasabiae]KGA27217.1 hypothetical protein KU73_18325 [Pectobacterium wasabiae]
MMATNVNISCINRRVVRATIKVVNTAPPSPHFWDFFEVKIMAMDTKGLTPLEQDEGNLSEIKKDGIAIIKHAQISNCRSFQ